MRCVIYWKNVNEDSLPTGIDEKEQRRRLRRYFHISEHTTVKGESEANVPEDRIDRFREGIRKGYYKVRNKKEA